MIEIKAVSYEQACTDFLKAEMEKAQNRMQFWQTKIKKAKNAIAEMEAHDNASNAGWEYNFYKDALEALEDNKFKHEAGFVRGFEAAQPKWISVEERLPEESGSYLVCTKRSDAFTAHFYLNTNEWKSHFAGSAGKHITHWMPLPPAPEVNK